MSYKPDYLSAGELIGSACGRGTTRSDNSHVDIPTADHSRTDSRNLCITIDVETACSYRTKVDFGSTSEASAGDNDCGAANAWPAGWANACHSRSSTSSDIGEFATRDAAGLSGDCDADCSRRSRRSGSSDLTIRVYLEIRSECRAEFHTCGTSEAASRDGHFVASSDFSTGWFKNTDSGEAVRLHLE